MPMTPPIAFVRHSLRRTRRLWPLLLLTAAPAALAQSPYGATVQPLPQPNDPAELLAQALRTLAVQPSNLQALTAAGHNALALGDPNAAVGFFGRAQEIAPRDGAVKAGLGSALVELEKPQDALRLFAEATRLGVPDAEIAEDRGLAYDLTGDPKRAQRDYAAVLAAHPDNDTVRRRLALSQGISGDKAAAIATLDPLIRKRDIAGWRAQTFVLAMNGDAAGASHITHIMLPQQADMLQPFLVRLATLSPADKARAVNFGEMPSSGHAYSSSELANTGTTPTYAASNRVASVSATPASPPRAAARASDLAPIPASTPRPAAAPPTRVATAAPTAPAATSTAPLAGVALAPATQTNAAATSAPKPVQIAQATPTPTPTPTSPASAAPSGADLPTPATSGHYDLPHAGTVRTPVRAAAPATTPMQTVGTPVVHGQAGKPIVEARPVKVKPAPDESDATSRSPHKAAVEEADDTTSAASIAKHKASSATTDDGASSKSRKGAHDKLAAAVESDDDSAAKKDHKSSRGKATTSDDADDQGSAKGRKGAHGKAATDDETDTGSKARKGAHAKSETDDETDAGAKSRKGGHATKSGSAGDSDDIGTKSRKSAHSKASSDEDADDGSSKSKKGSKADKTDKSEKAEPERVFVQVAGGANRDDMDKAWASVKKKAPELMKGRTARTVPIHATNRLMVGPFKSEDEAQAFVNKMAAKGLSGFTVKTGKGQKVEKIDEGQ